MHVIFNLKRLIENEILDKAFQILSIWCVKIERFKLLGDLNRNLAEEPFFELSMDTKIQLVKSLCEQLLVGDAYEAYCERIETRLVSLRNSLRAGELELAEKLEVPIKELTKNKEKCSA